MWNKTEHLKHIALIVTIFFPLTVFSQLTFKHEIGGKFPDFGISAIETKML